MMWKTLILLAVASAVLAGKIKRHQSNYEFHIKHDYDYHKHHDESEEHEHKTEEKPEEKHEPEDVEEKQEEEHIEEKKDEPEIQNEDDVASTEPEVPEVPEVQEVPEEPEVPEQDEKYEHQGYEFSYKVKDHHSHDIKGQHEIKNGDGVKGVYWLLQPDGLKRTVDYHADKHSGFHAKVDYSKSEEHEDNEHSKPTSEYYLTHYHGYKKYIPVKEEPEEQQDKQEESAQLVPIYVI